MKKLTLSAMMVAGLAAAALLGTPTIRDSAELEAIVRRQQLAQDSRHKAAGDKVHNVYADPDFASAWDRDLRMSPEAAHLLGLASWSHAAGNRRPLLQLVDEKDDSLMATVNEFEQVYPRFRAMLVRTNTFVVPEDGNRARPDLAALRTTLQSLSGYAEVKVAQGETAKAVTACLDGFQWAAKLVDARPRMVLNSTNLQTCEFLLGDPRISLSDQQLRDLSAALRAAAPAPGEEVEEVEQAIWELQTLPPSDTPPALRLAGFRQRDVRIYTNQLLRLAADLHAGRPPQAVPEFHWTGWLLGETSYLCGNSQPGDYFVSANQNSRLQAGLLDLWAQARLYQMRHGSWPQDLTQLQHDGYQPVPGFDAEKVRWQTRPNGDREMRLTLSPYSLRSAYYLRWPAMLQLDSQDWVVPLQVSP